MCKVFDIRNDKQKQMYTDVLDKNAKNKDKQTIFGFDTFRFVGDTSKLLPLIKEKKQQIRSYLEQLQLSSKDEPIELDEIEMELNCLTICA